MDEKIDIGKIDELLENTPTDDGTFYGVLYDLYSLIGILKGIDDANNGRSIPLEELHKEMEELYESTSRKFG